MYSVGIPVRNEEKTIVDTINSALNQSVKPCEILVCVNGSTDLTADVVSSNFKKNSLVKILESDPGKPNAWHEIYSKSQNDKVLMLDGDVLISDNSAMSILGVFDKKPDLSLVGGVIEYLEPNKKNLFHLFSHQNWHQSYDVVTGLTGSLYMLDKPKLESVCDDLGVPIMPRNIINEDDYLTRVGKCSNSIDYSFDAVSYVLPMDNFSEWFNRTKRLLRGNKQLRDEFSRLYYNSQDFDNSINHHKSNLSKYDSTAKKIGAVSFFCLRQIMNLGVDMENSKLYSNLWCSQNSSKSGFKNFK